MSQESSRDRLLYLKSLKLDGIREVYVDSEEINEVSSSQVAQEVASSAPTQESDGTSSSVRDQLIALREQALKCELCSELASKRTKVVFGSGNVKAKLMFIGEAPGYDEDQQGLPFVGKAGQLLTKIIESIELSRKEVFIANVLKCRPPQNRSPKPDEILNCHPFLRKQIELIQPQVICALGTFAAQTVLRSGESISRMRGRFIPLPETGLEHVQVMCTYHPAYLLRNPSEKRKVWEDMKKIRSVLQDGQA